MTSKSDSSIHDNWGKTPDVLWQQVGGVAMVQGAIALLWVIYNLYIGALLQQIGLSAADAAIFLIVENLLAALIEPLMGSLSDGAKQWMGAQLPWISGGAIAASGLFIAIPACLTFGTAASLQTILPIVIIVWAIAMALFRTPTVVLLGRYATTTELPYAASVLTMVGAIAGMLTPFAGKFILGCGAMFTFSLSSVILLGAVAWMRRVNLPVNKPFAAVTHSVPNSVLDRSQSAVLPFPVLRSLGLLLIVGIGVTMGTRILGQSFVGRLKPLPIEIGTGMGTMALTSAIAALPIGKLMTKWGIYTGLSVGLFLSMGLLANLTLVQTPVAAIGMAIAFGIVMSFIGNSTIPLALSIVPGTRAGLGTGLFFSGVAIGATLFFAFCKDQPEQSASLVGIGADAISVVCVVLLYRFRKGERGEDSIN